MVSPPPRFLTQTPRRVKTSSTPRNVRSFDSLSLKATFHSELRASIFDEGTLRGTNYDGDIIADCWFPNNILPLVPNDELLKVLMGPDGQPLYNSSTSQWDPRYLPPVLHKMPGPEGRPRLPTVQEERELSTFMSIVMDSLIRHRNNLTTPSELQASNTSLPGTIPSYPTDSPLSSDDSHRTTSPVLDRSMLSPPIVSAPDVAIPAEPHPAASSSLLSSTGSLSDASLRSTLRAQQEVPPRVWSSAAACRPLSGSVAHFKPDSVLVRKPADGINQSLEWSDILMTVELTSRRETADLISQIECKVLATFDAQPNRAFSYSLSFHAGQYRLYMYDRSGGVYSRTYDLHGSPVPLLRILCGATFAPTSFLGLDDSFDCRLHPIITVDDTRYLVSAQCFSTSVIRGRATTAWFVTKLSGGQNETFVIKDSWVNVERRLSEEEILEVLRGIECIPKVEKAWTVQRNGQDDSTSLRRSAAFMSHFKRPCDHRVRRRLVLTPAGRPITYAESPLELATCLLDLVIAHKKMLLRGILHRDISINNAMMYEEQLSDGTFRVRGLLIDFDYAINVVEPNRAVGPGDRTGTVPFMAIELLSAPDNEPVRHTAAHDLESFVYLLCWIVTLYAGPQGKLRDDSPKLALDGWYEGNDLNALASHKESCMFSSKHLKDITSYYGPLHSCVSALCRLVREQLIGQYDAKTTYDAYITGSKRPHSEDSETEVLNHDAVIGILYRTCVRLSGGQIPEPADVLQPYHFTKDHKLTLPIQTSTPYVDFGGGTYTKKRRMMRRIRGPVRTNM